MSAVDCFGTENRVTSALMSMLRAGCTCAQTSNARL